MIRNIVFDINGVLVGIDRKKIGKSRLHVWNLPLLYRVFTGPEYRDLNLGLYGSRREMLEKIDLSGKEKDRIRDFFLQGNLDLFRKERKMTEKLEELREHFRIFLLSNIDPDELELIKRADFYDRCDGACFSCEEKLMKPDRAFYERLLEKYGLKAEECLFIDDSRKNILTARQLGFHTFLHERKKETDIFLSSLIVRYKDQRIR